MLYPFVAGGVVDVDVDVSGAEIAERARVAWQGNLPPSNSISTTEQARGSGIEWKVL